MSSANTKLGKWVRLNQTRERRFIKANLGKEFYQNQTRYVVLFKLIIYTHIICKSTITSAPGHEHGYNGLWYDRMTGFTSTYFWSLILGLVSIWSSPLYDISVCPLLTSATAVFRISCWFLIVDLVKMFIHLPQISETEAVGRWAHKSGLTHLSLVHSPGPSVVLCVHYQ